MINQKLKKAVVKEALLIKKHANKKEKKDICEMIIKKQSSIYHFTLEGERFKFVIENCAKPYSEYPVTYIKSEFKSFKEKNAKRDFSAIEFYINQDGAKIKDLIKLIKS